MTIIPTIDLRQLGPNADARGTHVDELRRTVGTIGAFYLIGNGIEPGSRLLQHPVLL